VARKETSCQEEIAKVQNERGVFMGRTIVSGSVSQKKLTVMFWLLNGGWSRNRKRARLLDERKAQVRDSPSPTNSVADLASQKARSGPTSSTVPSSTPE